VGLLDEMYFYSYWILLITYVASYFSPVAPFEENMDDLIMAQGNTIFMFGGAI